LPSFDQQFVSFGKGWPLWQPMHAAGLSLVLCAAQSSMPGQKRIASFGGNGGEKQAILDRHGATAIDPRPNRPSYLQMKQGERVGATTLGDLTIGAPERLFNALPQCLRACVAAISLKDDV